MTQEKRHKTKGEVEKDYGDRMREWLGYAYSEGYGRAQEIAEKEKILLRSKVFREAGENDDKYAEDWRDNTTFYGWCTGCKRPHSGRWAHMWEYCPWCGGKIDRTDEPYPMGRKEENNGNQTED